MNIKAFLSAPESHLSERSFFRQMAPEKGVPSHGTVSLSLPK